MFRSTFLVLTIFQLSSWSVLATADELGRARELIQTYDTDADGKLDLAELEQALSGTSPQSLPFVRVMRDADGMPQALETAVVSFRSADGQQTVDLIAAIHVGDRTYYRELNRLFREYDAVLYELIAPEGTRIPRGGQTTDHPVGRMQRGIKSLLDLSFQLDEIDYTAKQLVHADMSPQEFASSMEERGESFLQILFRMMGQAAAQAGKADGPSDRDLIMALFAPDRALRLKRILAAQFEDLEGQLNIFEGPDGSTLISQRNKRVLQVLRRQQQQGQKKIGIFYGAGHMSDMAERLQHEFELKYASTRWMKAWDMEDSAH